MTEILPGGLVLRTAGPSDLDQIAALLTERGEAADAVDHRLVVEDPEAGWPACAVVVDGDRVVSTATLLDEALWLAGVPIPTGQVELVATDREYEGRGLVRALIGWAHRRSAERGQLAQLMIGIPYFYRLFGYVYAIPIVDTRPLVGPPPASPGHTVREVTMADIPAMAALQRTAQAGADLRMPHSDGLLALAGGPGRQPAVAGLSRRHPDVSAGPAARPLLSTLFPPVRSDILTLYLP